jgi:hypothetical protein
MSNTSHTQGNIGMHSLTSTLVVETLATIDVGTGPEH